MKEGLRYFTDIHLTSIGLLIFFCFFIGVVLWTSRKNSRSLYQRLENLPLQNGDSHE